MKIMFIGKYPPIGGGTASRAYWMIKGLAERGVDITVVTNAWETEPMYRTPITPADLEMLKPCGIKFYSTDPLDNPFYIPYANPMFAKLVNLALELNAKEHFDLIDTLYILPYTIAGYITKTMTGLPYILRHAGSDMERLLFNSYLNTFFKEVIRRADLVVTSKNRILSFLELGVPEDKIHSELVGAVDLRSFNPTGSKFDLAKYRHDYDSNLPVITFIGKVSLFKGIDYLLEAVKNIKEDYYLMLVVQGDVEFLKKKLDSYNLSERAIIVDYLPPWRVPEIYRVSTVVVSPEIDFPVVGHNPIVPREVMASGICPMLSTELAEKGIYKRIENNVSGIVFNPKDIGQFTEKLRFIINNVDHAKEIGYRARLLSESFETYDEFIDDTIQVYQKLSKRI